MTWDRFIKKQNWYRLQSLSQSVLYKNQALRYVCMPVVSDGDDFAIDLLKSVFEKHVSLVCGGRKTERSSVICAAFVRPKRVRIVLMMVTRHVACLITIIITIIAVNNTRSVCICVHMFCLFRPVSRAREKPLIILFPSSPVPVTTRPTIILSRPFSRHHEVNHEHVTHVRIAGKDSRSPIRISYVGSV